MNLPLTFAQAQPFIQADLEAGQTPALMGDPGIGKSSLVEGLARTFKTRVFTLPVNQLADRADLTGVRMVKNEKTGSWSQKAFPHSIIMEAIEYASEHPDEYPILFLDEFNRASSDITSSILSFQTLRRIGTIDFPENLRLIVAGNDKGNVTNLDKASISRFAVYHVKPDLDTFLSIQTLNPFVSDVLNKFPDDLMAEEVTAEVATTDDDDSDDDDEDEKNAFSQLEYLTEDAFTQITRPRTISYVSEWLNRVGLDKSGSDNERARLGMMFADITGESNVLKAGIEAHVGATTFALHLFDEIQTYFNTLLSAAHVSNQPTLNALRPSQDVINAMSRASDAPAIEALIGSMSEQDRLNTLVWLTEQINVREINNNDAVQAYMQNAPHQIKQFDNKALQNLMKVLPDANKVSSLAVNALLTSSAPMLAQWKGMIKLTMEQD